MEQIVRKATKMQIRWLCLGCRCQDSLPSSTLRLVGTFVLSRLANPEDDPENTVGFLEWSRSPGAVLDQITGNYMTVNESSSLG